MKLSKQTLEVLKNFSTVNQNLYVKPGNRISTMSPGKNLFASANTTETFEVPFGIYNLPEFLGVVSLLNDPDFEFNEKYVTIREGKNSVNYFYANREVLVVPPEKEFKMPSAEVKFRLTAEDMSAMKKSAAVLSATDFFIIGKNGVLSVVVGDPSNETANVFSIDLGETDYDFRVFFNVENLKTMAGDYDVTLSKSLVLELKNTAMDYTLHVALDKKSTFSV